MRYALIREMDVSNGEGLGVSLFVQGCPFHCIGCFNQETWDFNGGQEWTKEVQKKFFDLVERPYVKRISILGGEPLANENVEDVLKLVLKLKQRYPFKKIWIYTGYTYESIKEKDFEGGAHSSRGLIIETADVLVDGRFDIDKQDINHKQIKFAGSTNQRIIDLQKSFKQGKIVLYTLD